MSRGFESSFIESWSGWNANSVGNFTFYDCKLKDGLFSTVPGVDKYMVEIDLETCQVYVMLDGKGDFQVIDQKEFKLVTL